MAKIIKNPTYSLDIVNCESWDEAGWMSYFRDRLVKMRSKRQAFDSSWIQYEQQTNAVSFYDNEGNLNVNVPLEKQLKEIYMGRTNGKVNFDIVADGQTDIEELQPSKYSMMFFMDGNGKDNFWKENRYLRETKSTYGSGIAYTGIRQYKDFRYVVKEDADIQSGTDILNEKNFEKKINETWFFFPKAIHPKDFFIDDAAYGQPDVQYADDCIMKEKITMMELLNRYKDNKSIDQEELEKVGYWVDINKRNEDDQPIDVRTIVLYHYYHRVTKKYLIVANETNLLFNGLYLYNDGKLPFENVQHYSNVNRFRGEGIPERIAYLKAYKSEILQDILSGAAMASGIHLLVGNDDQIGQDWTVGGRGMNLWRTTGGVENVNPVNTAPNLNYFSAVLAILDKEVVTSSGINPLAQVEAQAPTLGQEQLLEENKAVRDSSVDENYNIGLDGMLTMMLSRIQQFAPSLLSEKIKDSKGKVIKTIFPKIKIDNVSIEKKGGKQSFVEDIGKYGYFELKPGVVQGVGVKVVTSSTMNKLPALEQDKITKYMNNKMTMVNMAAADPTGQLMKKVIDTINFEQLNEWINDAYGYDNNGLKANTKKDKLRQEALKKIDQIKSLLITPPDESNTGVPTQGNAMGMEQTPTNTDMTSGNSNNPVGTEIQGTELGNTSEPIS